MHDLFATRPPAYVIGLLVGLAVVGGVALLNERIGAVGGFSALLERASGRTRVLGWRGFFILGVAGGALLQRLLAGESSVGGGFGWLTRTFTGDARPLVGVLLVLGGVLIGYGAKLAGGCTSGNGVCGTSLGSPASFVATGTFMVTAILATFAIGAVT